MESKAEWTITPYSDSTSGVFCILHGGSVVSTYSYFGNAIRPTFSLTSDVELLNGSGAKENPYRIKI